jgi:hypothetical protein
MYTPTISNTEYYGYNFFPVEISGSFAQALDTAKCLYDTEFRPLYAQDAQGMCPYTTCFKPALWSRITQHSSILNQKNIWNDIIKRWEPTIFDQNFTEDIDVVSNYEFRSYCDVYKISVKYYENGCTTDNPMDTCGKGPAFSKAFDC